MAVLAEAEDAFGEEFLNSIDLLVGTSTGGIIALGLASGRTCDELLDFYRDLGSQIFTHPRKVRQLVRPKYDREPLDRLLRQEFGESTRMNDLSKAVCITAYELVTGTTRVWKDDHSSELIKGGNQLVWKVAAATSAAPLYFAPVQLGNTDSHVDGGVWGNNPGIVGVTEAVHYVGRPLSDIRMLSVGTTSYPLRVGSHRQAARMGLRDWTFKGKDLLQTSSSMAATNQARLLLSQDAYVRLDSENVRNVKLDDADQCHPLEEWGRDVGRNNITVIAHLFGLQRRMRPPKTS